MSEYHRLDFDKLYFAETPVSYGDAVKDAVPFDVSKGVMSRPILSSCRSERCSAA